MCNYARHLLYHTTPQPFYSPFFRTTWVSRCRKINFWTLWCKGRLTEADTPTIRLGATPSGLRSAHIHHPIFYRPDAPPAAQPTVSKHWRQTTFILQGINTPPETNCHNSKQGNVHDHLLFRYPWHKHWQVCSMCGNWMVTRKIIFCQHHHGTRYNVTELKRLWWRTVNTSVSERLMLKWYIYLYKAHVYTAKSEAWN